MKNIEKELLFDLYIREEMPMHQIAEKLGVSVGSVFKYIHKYGIESREAHQGFLGRTHSLETRKKIREKNKGKNVSKETRDRIAVAKTKGGIGHKKQRKDGYIYVYFPDHPKSTKEGYILEHILVMECLIGRYLDEREVVHHKNGKRSDNRKENLELMTIEEHARFHMKERHAKRKENDLLTK